jgi:hypothetical protein
MTDLEMWLIGTPDQVTAAMAALGTTCRVTGASKPETLFGADAGRVRRYLRVSVATVRSQPADSAAAASDERQGVIDINTRRRTA